MIDKSGRNIEYLRVSLWTGAIYAAFTACLKRESRREAILIYSDLKKWKNHQGMR